MLLGGTYNGSCHTTKCRNAGATWWNKLEQVFVCRTCAMRINHVNKDEGHGFICTHKTEDEAALLDNRGSDELEVFSAD